MDIIVSHSQEHFLRLVDPVHYPQEGIMRKILLISLFGFFVISFSFAHNPIFPPKAPNSLEDALEIKDPSISQVYYSKISQSDPYTWMKFEAREGDKIKLSVGVPVIDRLKDLVPTAALIGPGLPIQDLPFRIPEGYGSAFLIPKSPPSTFLEEFTHTKSWIYVDQKLTILRSGTYYFVAYPRTITAYDDKLWMVIGTKERFGLKELLSFSKIMKFVRGFHEMK
jgi:hypothetical protein